MPKTSRPRKSSELLVRPKPTKAVTQSLGDGALAERLHDLEVREHVDRPLAALGESVARLDLGRVENEGVRVARALREDLIEREVPMIGDAVLDLELELEPGRGVAELRPDLRGPDLEVEAALRHRLVLVRVAERAAIGAGGE